MKLWRKTSLSDMHVEYYYCDNFPSNVFSIMFIDDIFWCYLAGLARTLMFVNS